MAPPTRYEHRRGQVLETALSMLRDLYREDLRAVEIAERYGCHRRTIYRIVGAFRAMGIEVSQTQQGREVFFSVDKASVRRALLGG